MCKCLKNTELGGVSQRMYVYVHNIYYISVKLLSLTNLYWLPNVCVKVIYTLYGVCL